jgi:acetone carboxylase gamma subunit
MRGKVKANRLLGALGLTVNVAREEEGKPLTAFCANCRQKLATAPACWKTGAALAESHLGGSTRSFVVAPVVRRRNPRVILREFFCPGCTTLLESEVVLEGTSIEDDVRPDFYVLPA